MTDPTPQLQPKFCSACGAPVYPLKGTNVLTCRRGHHQPNHWGEIAVARGMDALQSTSGRPSDDWAGAVE